MQAIETVYRGYHFRSRLEAKWAVFFDGIGLQYDYEPEGFEIEIADANGQSILYLPDFYFPAQRIFVDIKPTLDSDLSKPREFAKHSAIHVVHGNPWPWDYYISIPTFNASLIPALPAQFAACNNCKSCSICLILPKDGTCIRSLNLQNDACKDCYGIYLKYGENPFSSETKISKAYIAARQARFEHGETPQ